MELFVTKYPWFRDAPNNRVYMYWYIPKVWGLPAGEEFMFKTWPADGKEPKTAEYGKTRVQGKSTYILQNGAGYERDKLYTLKIWV